MSVHYRNKALIKHIGVNSFKTYCKQYFIVLLSILINLLRTEMSEIHSDEAMKAYDKILLKMLDAITLYDCINQFHCAEAKSHFTVSNPMR